MSITVGLKYDRTRTIHEIATTLREDLFQARGGVLPSTVEARVQVQQSAITIVITEAPATCFNRAYWAPQEPAPTAAAYVAQVQNRPPRYTTVGEKVLATVRSLAGVYQWRDLDTEVESYRVVVTFDSKLEAVRVGA